MWFYSLVWHLGHLCIMPEDWFKPILLQFLFTCLLSLMRTSSEGSWTAWVPDTHRGARMKLWTTDFSLPGPALADISWTYLNLLCCCSGFALGKNENQQLLTEIIFRDSIWDVDILIAKLIACSLDDDVVCNVSYIFLFIYVTTRAHRHMYVWENNSCLFICSLTKYPI